MQKAKAGEVNREVALKDPLSSRSPGANMELLTRRIWRTEKSIISPLYINGASFGVTLELPWKNNQEDVSCIIAGRYPILLRPWEKRLSGLFPQLQGVPGRNGIFIHILNTPSETEGCIGIGLERGAGNIPDRIMGSTRAFQALCILMLQALSKGEDTWIEIKEE